MTRNVGTACILLLGVVICSPVVGARRRAVRTPSPPLAISTVEPRSGSITGGTSLTIQGSGFSPNDLGVFFDDQPATSLTYVTASEVRAVTPPHANGYVPVRVVNQGRSASAEFLYTPPSLDSIAVGAITTVAGIGLYHAEGGSAKAAPVDLVGDILIDTGGTVFLSERDRYVVRTIASDGTFSRFAGRGLALSPSEAAAGDLGDGRSATSTAAPTMGMAIGPDGNVYLAVMFEHRIRRVDRQTGIITTVAGSGPISYNGAFTGDGGPATQARLDQPNQVVFDRGGNMYILDGVNYRIRSVTPAGIIRTVAGNGTRGFSGDGGPATLASFNIGPNGDTGALKIDGDGNLYLADSENRRIRRIDRLTGLITTIAGGGTRHDDAARATDLEISVNGIAVAGHGTTYYSDGARIRRIEADETVRTLFGEPAAGFSEDGVRAGRLSGPGRMELDTPRNRLLFGESGTSRVRSIDLATRTLSTVAGIGPAAFGENGPAVGAELDGMDGLALPIAVTPDDAVLIGGYRRLRRLERDGTLQTIAGGGLNPHGPPSPQRPALGTPIDTLAISVATNGDNYVTGPFEVGRISAPGTYERIAGGAYGYSGDNGPASAATFDNPAGIAVDGSGNLFVADTFNHCIRRIDGRTGIITTFAGKSPAHPPNVWIPNTSSGDGGRAVDAQLESPRSLATVANGNVYVIDLSGVRMIDGNGMIDTVFRSSPAQCNATLLASNRVGRLFVRCGNGQIMRIDGPNSVTVVGGTSGRHGFSGDGGPAAQSETRTINGMAIDLGGNVYLLDSGNSRVRAIRGIGK